MLKDEATSSNRFAKIILLLTIILYIVTFGYSLYYTEDFSGIIVGFTALSIFKPLFAVIVLGINVTLLTMSIVYIVKLKRQNQKTKITKISLILNIILFLFVTISLALGIYIIKHFKQISPFFS